MDNYTSIISEIKLIRRQRALLAKRESEISKPKLTDQELLPELYRCFRQLCPSQSERRRSVRTRKQFIFIILMLYSPAALAGGKILPGLRDRIAEVLDLTASSTISNNLSDLDFLYQNYKDFHDETNQIYAGIIHYLKSRNLLP